MYVYFYSLHVSGSHVPINRRINCINTTSGIQDELPIITPLISFSADSRLSLLLLFEVKCLTGGAHRTPSLHCSLFIFTLKYSFTDCVPVLTDGLIDPIIFHPRWPAADLRWFWFYILVLNILNLCFVVTIHFPSVHSIILLIMVKNVQ
jgi:hypothetical protein